MTVNLATCTIKADGGNTSRSFGDRHRDIINVKDFGAVGDGVTNDYVAIQAAFDYAFGSSSDPHSSHPVGGNNGALNYPVHFPAGTYIIGTPLVVTKVHGGWIFGDGSAITKIQYTGSVPGSIVDADGNTVLLLLDGWVQGRIEGLAFDMPARSGSNLTVCISNQTRADFFSNNSLYVDLATMNAHIGIAHGLNFSGSSEPIHLECTFTDHDSSFGQGGCGLTVTNWNALGAIVSGCTFTNCYKGINNDPPVGSFGNIMGCKFVNSVYRDMALNVDSIYLSGNVSENSNPDGGGFNFDPKPIFVGTEAQGIYMSCCRADNSNVSPPTTSVYNISWAIYDNCDFPLGVRGGSVCVRGGNIGSISNAIGNNATIKENI